MQLGFWGVRGSIPAPGPATVRYGGNTACVSVRPEGGGLYMISNENLSITSSTVSGNSLTTSDASSSTGVAYGGGVYVQAPSASA